MNANEKIVVDHYECDCYVDDFANGEVGKCTSCWDNVGLPVKGEFNTAAEALKAVCDKNCFSFDAEKVASNWCNWAKEYGEEHGRFSTDILVDDANSEASESEIELWKNGEKKLYACHLNVWLKVVATRDLTDEECKI